MCTWKSLVIEAKQVASRVAALLRIQLVQWQTRRVMNRSRPRHPHQITLTRLLRVSSFAQGRDSSLIGVPQKGISSTRTLRTAKTYRPRPLALTHWSHSRHQEAKYIQTLSKQQFCTMEAARPIDATSWSRTLGHKKLVVTQAIISSCPQRQYSYSIHHLWPSQSKQVKLSTPMRPVISSTHSHRNFNLHSRPPRQRKT